MPLIQQKGIRQIQKKFAVAYMMITVPGEMNAKNKERPFGKSFKPFKVYICTPAELKLWKA